MQTDLLVNDRNAKKDLAMVSQAVRRFGSRLKEVGPEIVDRLMTIMQKKTVQTLTKDGDVVEVESLADEHAMQAAAILQRAIALDQKEDHHVDRMNSPASFQMNILNQVNGGTVATSKPDRVTAATLAERVRASRLSGPTS